MQLNSLPHGQVCLFNTALALKPIVIFDLGLNAETNGDVEAASQAFSDVLPLAKEMNNTHIFHLALGHLAGIQLLQGRLQAACHTHKQALSQAGSIGEVTSPYIALAHAGLGVLYYEWNDLSVAEQHFTAGLPLARSWNQWESLIPNTLGLARVKVAQGDLPAAMAILDAIKELPPPPIADMTKAVEVYKALLWAASGDREAAESWLQHNEPAPITTPDPQSEMILLEEARLQARLDHADVAMRMLEKILNSAQDQGRNHTVIQLRVLQAKLFAGQGYLGQALNALEAAVRLAAAENYIRSFVDEGETIRRLLGELRSKASLANDLAAYIGQVLAGFEDRPQRSTKRETTGGLPEGLSEREAEVLGLVAEGLTNQNIADRLVISITTVKTHVGNIYQKLGVTNRTQAVARAEALGLLPRS